jgi:predicted Rossmann fold nucleotide-binding protein DprA/Smf involved in DNA uptake
MTATHSAQDDRISMVAACTTLGLPAGNRGREDVLSNQEWNQLAQWLGQQQMRPADLLYADISELSTEGLDPQIAFKASAIAERASIVALEIEQLENVGIWTLSRMDEGYPQRWKSRLKSASPPVIFGTGPRALMDRSSVAIVGSREITDELGEIANSIGVRVAQAGLVVVSGGARGSDKVGMQGALQIEGHAVGVLPADLAKLSRQRDVREYIAHERLCFVTQVNPAAGFSVGNAMGRNRLIYALSDLTIVIATAAGSGGTWAGATANLKRGWAPLAVWTGAGAPAGNHQLIQNGAFPFSAAPADRDDLRLLIEDAATYVASRSNGPDESPNQQLSLMGT